MLNILDSSKQTPVFLEPRGPELDTIILVSTWESRKYFLKNVYTKQTCKKTIDMNEGCRTGKILAKFSSVLYVNCAYFLIL